MIKNYFKTALRTLIRNKLYTILNIAGLTFSMSCFLIIGLYIFDELTFDTQHSKADRIYRVIEHKNVNGESTTIAAASYKLAEESKKTIPGIENTARIRRTGRANIVNPENPANFFQETVTIADENFLSIFDFPLIAGDKKTALADPNSIIITEDLAMRLFNKTDVLGKTLQFSFMQSPLKVTGVLKNHQRNSSFDFSSVLSDASSRTDSFYNAFLARDWFSENFSVYALLKSNTDPKSVATQMAKLVHGNFTPPAGTTFSFSLQPLKDIHLNSGNIIDGARNSNVDAIVKGSMFYIEIFSFIALFVLLIAGINYMNLTTARASSRLKEIGVRKTIGALQGNLIRQFLFESLMVTFISFLLSLAVVNLALPAFNQFTSKQISLGFSTDYRVWLYAIAFAVITGFLSGSYPALMLSRFKPILLLKSLKLQNRSGLSLRKGLVVFQFTISIVMIIATIVLFLQVHYLNHTDLGFNKNLLVIIDVNTRKARTNFEAVKAEMAKIPTVENVSVTSRVPGEWKSFRTVKIKTEGSNDEPKVAYMIGADKDFLTTYKIKLLQGRNFDTPADSSDVIINEAAAEMLDITEPAGQIVEIPALSRNGDGTFVPLNNENIPFKPRVIGIVKDFHFQSLRDKIEPMILCYDQNPIQVIDYYSARIAATNIRGTLDKLKEVMIKNDKDDPFEYHFLNDQLALFYIEDERRQTILIWAAFATIFIACLGLFGLATYSAEQRIKEIGVRKVLGATVLNLASILSKDFLKLVFIANGIAFPIAWWAANKWLQEYAYHINVQWWVFVIAGISACVVALLTVSYQAIKAAMVNPVKSLRTE
ncbi:MAG TPA: ABC transporter permease [Chitinophagaceae bacterium]|jgi:putative ABC transport system permease protein|nr:ABC transporter permease [Chitinophagaceae bacterium]